MNTPGPDRRRDFLTGPAGEHTKTKTQGHRVEQHSLLSRLASCFNLACRRVRQPRYDTQLWRYRSAAF
jgi:hypothetical protein